jgi:hypothetical protein
VIPLKSADGWHERFALLEVQFVIIVVRQIQDESFARLSQIYLEVLVVVVVVRDHLHCRGTTYVGALNWDTAWIKEVDRCLVPEHFFNSQTIP